MRISKVIFICCFLLPFLASCTRDEIEDNSYPLAEYDDRSFVGGFLLLLF